ncbi:hypothetical protein ACQPYA_23380 [Micromonospora sp. CA-263727]|uniref:hypothetical protein n=1 Tax=Micromonospora sp. CA-263727 TaxID=3239967 RepID=UPI003D93FF33
MNAWRNAFNRLQCCYERKVNVGHAYFDLADTIITVRSLTGEHGPSTDGTTSGPAGQP